MREIKFRCFYYDTMYPVVELHGADGMGANAIEMYLPGEGLRMVSPDSEHVKGLMQFTGLRDSLGAEVYEGDILAEDYADEQNEEFHRTYYEVLFQNGAFVAMEKGSISAECLSEIGNEFYITGNIHENPELLK